MLCEWTSENGGEGTVGRTCNLQQAKCGSKEGKTDYRDGAEIHTEGYPMNNNYHRESTQGKLQVMTVFFTNHRLVLSVPNQQFQSNEKTTFDLKHNSSLVAGAQTRASSFQPMSVRRAPDSNTSRISNRSDRATSTTHYRS